MKTTANKPHETLAQDLSRRYGEVIGGRTLWHVLGYNTLAAFKQAIARGALTLPTFFIAGRKGRFALTSDVAEWLLECRAKAGKPRQAEVPASLKKTKSN